MENENSTASILKDFWRRILHREDNTARGWDEYVMTINKCGRGLEETLRYLYQQQPTAETFLQWMTENENSENTEAVTEDVLTAEDLAFFSDQGYLVFHNAISERQCADTRQAILDFLEIDIDNPDTWHQPNDGKNGLMVMLYQHPALNVNRNSPRIKKAFVQLYGTDKIHKVIEKVSFNPPETSSHKFMGSALHWDVSLTTPIPFKLQGLLYLNDVQADGGAFHCVPGFHHQIETWLSNLPENVNPRDEAVATLQPKAVPGKAGDLVIWSQALPHRATPNRSNVPRFVQYITYNPDDYKKQDVWK